jgi:hypothetical protein
MKQIKDYSVEKETEKAYLIKINNDLFWFAKSKVIIENGILEMTEEIFNNKTKLESNESMIIINTLVEDYSESSFKIILKIKKEEYQAEKFMFLPKSKIKEFTENSLTLPKWVYDRSLKEILKKECEFYNEKYTKEIEPDDYEVLTEVVEL